MLSKTVRIKPWDIPIITLPAINLGLIGEIVCQASNFYNIATQVTGKDDPVLHLLPVFLEQ